MTGAGSPGSRASLGQLQRDGLKQPPFVGIVTSVSTRTANTPPLRAEGTQFSGPSTADVPAKSNSIVPSVRHRDFDAHRLSRRCRRCRASRRSGTCLGIASARRGHVSDRAGAPRRRHQESAVALGRSCSAPATVQAASWAFRSPISVSGSGCSAAGSRRGSRCIRRLSELSAGMRRPPGKSRSNWAEAIGRVSTDVTVMRHGADSARRVGMEHGHHDRDIGEMRAAAVGIVEDVSIAFTHACDRILLTIVLSAESGWPDEPESHTPARASRRSL